MHRYRRLSTGLSLALLALVLLTTAGCADDGGPAFNNEGAQQISCLQHQSEPPGSRYTEAGRSSTADLFAVLRYYTAHGGKPYCDGAPPTDADRAWAELYVREGADRANVAAILDRR